MHSNTFFVELNRVGSLLRRSERYEPVFLFAWPYPTVERDVRECLDQGFRCLDQRGDPVAASAPHLGLLARAEGESPTVSWLRRTARLAAGILTRPLVGDALEFLRFHRRRGRFAGDVLQRERCALLVMAGDMVGYDTAAFVRAAHAGGVPVALVPSTMSNGLEQAEVYFHNPDYRVRGLANRLAALRYPRWVREHRGQRLLRRPAGDVFAMEWLGIAPPLPWIFNSGFADAIAAESEAMADYYLEGGLPRGKLALVGSLANDALAKAGSRAEVDRAGLYERLGLRPGLPMILSALPPDFLYVEGGRPECDFRSYGDLVHFWIESLLAVKAHNVVLSLHPSVDAAAMRHHETDRLKIGPANTASLVPLCDVFVTSVSSTIRWAIACGKPVVNYDVYRYHYTDFQGVRGVLAVEETEGFRETLMRLTEDQGFYREVAAAQEASAPRWGRLDGRAGARMLQLFDFLLADRGPGVLPHAVA